MVTGRLRFREWEKDGERRQGYELAVEEIGRSLRGTSRRRIAAGVTTSSTGGGWSGGADDAEPPF